MYQQINVKKTKKISEVLAIAGMVLLLVDVADTFIAQGRYGFLPVNDQQRGIVLGVPSIILFFLSFGFGFRIKSNITTSILIVGGSLLAISKIVEPTIGLNLFLAVALRPLYLALIVMGFVIVGLGGLRMLQGDKLNKNCERSGEE